MFDLGGVYLVGGVMSQNVSIEGWSSTTSKGSRVWAGYWEEQRAICLSFTNTDGEVTKLALSIEGARAMVSLCQKVIPPIAAPEYELLLKFIGDAAEKLKRSPDGAVWTVSEPTP